MSLRRSWSDERSRLFAPARRVLQARGSSQVLVGRDFSREAEPARSRVALWAALVGGALIAALLTTSLRVDILRLRYALGEAVKEEATLLERSRVLTVARRELRDPHHLRRLAEQRGFVRPGRVIHLNAAETRR
jgi:hypothetical protein